MHREQNLVSLLSLRTKSTKIHLVSLALTALCVAWFLGGHRTAFADTATATISIIICGDAILNVGEVCDDGLFNLGGYSSTTAGRQCVFNCSGYGPYCGDGVFQALYGEECDDGNAVNGDLCTDHCIQEAPPVSTTTPPVPPPPPSGGNGGGGALAGNIPIRAQTKVILQGKAYPGASVNVLKDGAVVGVVQADIQADFVYETTEITPGPTTFAFWAIDQRGVRSVTFATTFQVTQNAVTTVSNVYLPPTISLNTKKMNLGEPVDALGATAPFAKVSLYVDKEKDPRVVATSTPTGLWSATFLSDGLSNEAFHAVRAMFELLGGGTQAKSGYSQAVSFYVGAQSRPTSGIGDLNGDGKVNLVDFSILLFHWNTDHAIADLNQDGKVNLIDFSILLFNWTG